MFCGLTATSASQNGLQQLNNGEKYIKVLKVYISAITSAHLQEFDSIYDKSTFPEDMTSQLVSG